MDLDKLLHLKNAPFEEGHKLPHQIVARRIAKSPAVANALPNITQELTANFGLNAERHRQQMILNTLSILPHQSEELIINNLIFLPNLVHLRASPFHLDRWGRDLFYTFLGINAPETEICFLNEYLKGNRRFPQAPTTKLFLSDRQWYFDDESTALTLIWRAKLAQNGVEVTASERCQWQDRLDWLLEHSEDGFYVTPEGAERSWFDSFVFPKPDTSSHVQGNYATSLIAAEALRLRVPNGEISQAIGAYNSLIHSSGRLQFSRRFPYKDTSSLFGEFLALELFNTSLLDPSIVITTIETLDKTPSGFKVVTKEDGSFLNPSQFNSPYQEGDYQNGADWPFYSAVAMNTAQKHGFKVDLEFWKRIVNNLEKTQNAEYTRSDVSEPKSSRYNPKRIHHTCNALVYVLADHP